MNACDESWTTWTIIDRGRPHQQCGPSINLFRRESRLSGLPLGFYPIHVGVEYPSNERIAKWEAQQLNSDRERIRQAKLLQQSNKRVNVWSARRDGLDLAKLDREFEERIFSPKEDRN